MRSSLNQGKMWLAKDFFSISLGVEQSKRRIRDELCRFSIITNPPKTAFQESKRTYSGKVAGMQDDVAVVMQVRNTDPFNVRHSYSHRDPRCTDCHGGYNPILLFGKVQVCFLFSNSFVA